MTSDDHDARMGRILAKASADAAFRQRLLADPGAVLTEEGVSLPAGLEIRVAQNDGGAAYLVLAPAGAPLPLDDASLAAAAGGYTYPGGKKPFPDPVYKLD